jgi:hypothetical protein
MKMCKKSLQQVLAMTPNVLCISIQSEDEYKYNPMKNIFNPNKIMRVGNMSNAFDKAIKQFRDFMRYNAADCF